MVNIFCLFIVRKIFSVTFCWGVFVVGDLDMGHCGPGAISESWSCVLSRRRLLHSGVRRVEGDNVPCTRQLARRVSHPSESARSGPFSVCRSWKQSGSGCERGRVVVIQLVCGISQGVRTSIFGWRTFPNLWLIHGWHVTTWWVKGLQWVNQQANLSLPSLWGR